MKFSDVLRFIFKTCVALLVVCAVIFHHNTFVGDVFKITNESSNVVRNSNRYEEIALIANRYDALIDNLGPNIQQNKIPKVLIENNPRNMFVPPVIFETSSSLKDPSALSKMDTHMHSIDQDYETERLLKLVDTHIDESGNDRDEQMPFDSETDHDNDIITVLEHESDQYVLDNDIPSYQVDRYGDKIDQIGYKNSIDIDRSAISRSHPIKKVIDIPKQIIAHITHPEQKTEDRELLEDPVSKQIPEDSFEQDPFWEYVFKAF